MTTQNQTRPKPNVVWLDSKFYSDYKTIISRPNGFFGFGLDESSQIDVSEQKLRGGPLITWLESINKKKIKINNKNNNKLS